MIALDAYFDFVCPWCFLFKRRLDAALRQLDDAACLKISLRSYELHPALPEVGVDRREFLRRKFGADEGGAQMAVELQLEGKEAGIAFRFNAIDRMPNSMKAHRLFHAAGRPIGLADSIMRAHFEDGADIGSEAVLRELGASKGIDASTVQAAWHGHRFIQEVRNDHARAIECGLRGVPAAVCDGRAVLQGAQSVDAITSCLRRLAGNSERAAEQD